MNNKTIKIVITGAESTGKSILSDALAKHYNAPWIPELAREYVEKLNRQYTYNDIELIARKQIEIEQDLPPETSVVFFDTWLIITKVWFEFVFSQSPNWLNDYISASNIDLFLLCDIDIPWEADPVRENGGETRKILHETYINELSKYGFTYKIISGKGESRTLNAIKTIDEFLETINER